MRYAQRTTVTAIKTRLEIEALVLKYGADQFGQAQEVGRAMVQFRLKGGLVVRFLLPLNGVDGVLSEQAGRQRWRALLLCIKAKLEAVETGIETVEHAFLAEIVLPDGHTMAEWAVPQIRALIQDKRMPPSLLEDRRN